MNQPQSPDNNHEIYLTEYIIVHDKEYRFEIMLTPISIVFNFADIKVSQEISFLKAYDFMLELLYIALSQIMGDLDKNESSVVVLEQKLRLARIPKNQTDSWGRHFITSNEVDSSFQINNVDVVGKYLFSPMQMVLQVELIFSHAAKNISVDDIVKTTSINLQKLLCHLKLERNNLYLSEAN